MRIIQFHRISQELLYITAFFPTYLHYLLISIPTPKFCISSSHNPSSFPDIMLVARSPPTPKPLTPVPFGTIFTSKTILAATLFYSVYQNDDKQYQAYQPTNNNSGKLLSWIFSCINLGWYILVMAAWNSGGKVCSHWIKLVPILHGAYENRWKLTVHGISILQVDIDAPVYGGGMVTFRFSDTGDYFGFSKLEAGAPVVAVSNVHATLFTLAPVSWGGTLEKKFM